MLVIDYEERLVADVIAATSGLQIAVVKLESEYTSSVGSFWEAMLVVFILLHILVGVLTVIRMFIWSRYHPPNFSPDNYGWFVVWTLVFTLADTWALVFFWFLFFVAGYWFIVFKLQENAFLLLPPLSLYQDHYLAFDVLFGIVLMLKFLLLMVRLYR